MRIQYDTHLHSDFSMDSKASVTSQINRAVELGLSGICFTDHMDYGFPADQCPGCEENPFQFDVDNYIRTLTDAKKQYPDFEINIGVECGLQADPDILEANNKLCENPAFDQVIGSIHLIDKKDPYYPEFWSKNDPDSIIKKYFITTLDNLTVFSNFNILGHLDYAVRYSPSDYMYHPESFLEITDEIMNIIIKKGIALEVNTSGIYKTKRTGDRNPNPHPVLIRRYYELGGRLISIGSDAHDPSVLACEFDYAAELLTDIGFTEYVTFKNRKPILHALL